MQTNKKSHTLPPDFIILQRLSRRSHDNCALRATSCQPEVATQASMAISLPAKAKEVADSIESTQGWMAIIGRYISTSTGYVAFISSTRSCHTSMA